MPELNEIAHGIDIGKKRGYDYIYLACKMCGKPRWVKVVLTNQPDFTNLCSNGCQQKQRASKTRDATLYWDGKSKLKVGMLKSQPELLTLGINVPLQTKGMMIWYECPKCLDTP